MVLLLSVVVSAEEPQISITSFGRGMNTNTSLLKLKPNESSVCRNYDIGEDYLVQRAGYMKLFSEALGDTGFWGPGAIGLSGFRRADGVRRIAYILQDTFSVSNDKDGMGWFRVSCDNCSGASGSYYWSQQAGQWAYYDYVYPGVTPHWTYWNDRLYMTNGRQRPLVFHPYNEMGRDGYVRELVPLTPGEPLIVPMDVVGNLNGEYYYIISHNSPCGSATGADSLTNGAFTNWTGNKPDDWDTLFHGTSTIIEEATVKMGSAGSSVRFTNERLFKNTDSVGVTQEVQVTDDSTYRASVWINARNDDGMVIRMTIRDTSGTLIDNVDYFGSTDGWIKLEATFTPTSGQDAIDLLVSFVGDDTEPIDTCYIDSALVQRIDPLGERLGVVTKPVIANNENVLLTNFGWQTIASGCAYDAAAYDTMDLEIYRTKANQGEINEDNKFWLIATLNMPVADSSSAFDTLVYIDTLADSAIGHGDYVTFVNINNSDVGRDSNLVLSGVRVGAPTYVGKADGVHDIGYIFGIPIGTFEFLNKISYICTYYDTLINAESDSSRSLHIFHNDTADSVYVIGLPPIPGGKEHLIRKLYKSYSYIFKRPKDSIGVIKDTTINIRGTIDESEPFLYNIITADRDISISVTPAGRGNSRIPRPDWKQYRIKYYDYVPSVDSTLDTITTHYKLIAEIKKSDSIFIDDILFDSTQKGNPYFKSSAPFNLTNITSFNDALFGSVGSFLKWSYLDSGSVWGSFRDISLDEDDGDYITAILPFRTYIKVYKNKSQYAVYPGGGEFEYERQETVDGLGCIASHSALTYQNAIFYLSEIGVIYEQGSVNRDRGSQFGIISEPINNILLNRTRDALRKAYGFIFNDKYWLSFSEIDTTFVYHLKTGGWSIYSYAFAQPTMYDTLSENSKNRVPSGDMVFINGDDNRLYKADTTSTDSTKGAGGKVINTHYRSAPLVILSDDYKINKFGIWRESNDATGGIDVRLYNAEGDSVWYQYVDTIAKRYDIYGVNVDVSNYFQIDIQDTTLDSLAIDKIDNWLDQMGTIPED